MDMSICMKPQLNAVAVRLLDRTKIINWTPTIIACKPREYPVYTIGSNLVSTKKCCGRLAPANLCVNPFCVESGDQNSGL
jgi:hypothetical protein